MKPIRLQARNIGPHAYVDLDFRDYADSLFLISGETGSGKTTIFDLLVTALYYNNAQFKVGDKRFIDLRSEFAAFTSKEPSSILLEFSHRGKVYRVERSWTPKRVTWDPDRPFPSLFRDQHLFSEIQDGYLVGPSYTKVAEVTQAIEELLHLNKDQFQRILLLPQHNFKRFLLANSKEKEEILQTLFDVDSYHFLVENLKEKRKQDRQKIEARDLEMIVLARSVVGEEQEFFESGQIQGAMTEALQAFTKEKDREEQELEMLEEQVQEVFAELQVWQQRRDWEQNLKEQEKLQLELLDSYPSYQEDKKELELLDQLEGGQILLDRQEQLSQQKLALLATEKQLKREKQDLDTVIREFSVEEKRVGKEDEEELRQKIADLEYHYEKLLECQQLVQQLESKQTELSNLQIERKRYQQLRKKNQEELIQIDGQLQALKQKSTNWSQLMEYQTDYHHLQQQNQKIEAQKLELAAQSLQLENIQSQITDLTQSSQEQDFRDFQKTRWSLALDMVRSQVHPGDDCPVCQNKISTPPIPSLPRSEEKYVQLEIAYYEQKLELSNLQQSQANLEEHVSELKLVLEAEEATYQSHLHSLTSQLNPEHTTLNGLKQALQSYQESLETHVQKEEDMRERREALLALQNTYSLKFQELELSSEQAYHQIQEWEQDLKNIERQFGNQSLSELEVKLETQKTTLKNFQIAKENLSRIELRLVAQRQAYKTKVNQQAENSHLYKEASSKNNKALEQLRNEVLPEVEMPEFLVVLQEISKRGKLRQQLTQFETQLQGVRLEISRLKANEPKIIQMDNPQEREILLATLESAVTQKKESLVLIQSRIDHALAIEKQLEELNQDQVASNLLYSQLDQLVQVLSGQTESRLDIKAYVLQHYFNQIVEVANDRYYHDFSQGRYQFVLKNQKSSGRSLAGLDLDVLDQEVGQLRPVSTLSGGESFLASMALALATSDVIQESQGGIELEALFIDEGFGSLDQETLLVTLDVLESLGRDGRMIGLISHVEVMKQGISKQILVEKRGSGRSSVQQVSL
ncbi:MULTISPECIES: SbcC/MukB-like Walker B domain-containing protein [unclassified Streptococcus]|uniref:SbcC/MukB-like Walker B domain-containing protein n=1 Tax=unclassified Streptococcus TaxID=2608887 RepID=UPI00107240DF|nr:MULTISPECIES: SMC family ATPase [unclassified Streptococcus]MBF0805301.1 SMC family ATPase [Streptococcus sp. 19428wA2_WM07]TFU29335.1 SMC family ATPase [Streptococcus sp. WM07]